MAESNHSNLYKVLSGLISNQSNIFTTLSASNQKLSKIILSGDGSVFLGDDGVYHTIQEFDAETIAATDLGSFQNNAGFIVSGDILSNGQIKSSLLPESSPSQSLPEGVLISGDILTNGLIKSNLLPSYVDDVIEGYIYNGTFYSGPGTNTPAITGETGKLYVDLADNDTYNHIFRWSGSAFTDLTAISTPGSDLTKYDALYNVYSPISSQLSSGYKTLNAISANLITASSSYATNSGHFANDTIHVTSQDKTNWNAKLDSSALTSYATTGYVDGKISDVMNTIPSNVSELTNDENYINDETIDSYISGKQDKITSSSKLAYSLLSGTPDLDAGESSVDYLLFKIPNNSNSNAYYDLELTFSENDAFAPTLSISSVIFTNELSTGRFYIGNANTYMFADPVTLGIGSNGIPYQYSNCIIRYSLTALKENSATSGFNRVMYRWKKTVGADSPVYEKAGFGMINGESMIFNNDIDKAYEDISTLSGDVSTLSTAVQNISTGLSVEYLTANKTINALAHVNKWYMILGGSKTITLNAVTGLQSGDMLKFTVNSSSVTTTINVGTTPVYGETTNGWGSISTLSIDIPETITLVYQEAGSGTSARWNLVESSRL